MGGFGGLYYTQSLSLGILRTKLKLRRRCWFPKTLGRSYVWTSDYLTGAEAVADGKALADEDAIECIVDQLREAEIKRVIYSRK